jgi:hypothetical protein
MVDGERVAPVERSIEVPHYHSPSSTAVDSDSTPNIHNYAHSAYGAGSTDGITVDLTTLATIGPIKWCGEIAAETPPPNYESPPDYYGQHSGMDINLPAPTLNSQEAIDFVLE